MVNLSTIVSFTTAVAAGLIQQASAAAPFKIDLKCAVIVGQDYANGVSDAGRVFQSASIPYSEIVIPSGGLQGQLPLENAGDYGKYSCIVKGPTAYKVGDNYVDMMTPAQYEQLQTYESKYSVRRVVLESNPDAVPGMGSFYAFTTNGLPPNGTVAKLTADWKKANPTSIVNPDVSFNLAQDPYQYGVYTIGAYIKTPATGTLTPFLTLNKNSDQQQPLQGMVVEQDCSKSWERLHLFLSTRNPDSNSVALSYVWAEWVTKGMFIGARRILFSTQVDDFFLATELWDKDPAKNEKTTARVSDTDVGHLVNWQTQLNAKLPKGSNVRLELAYNGLGVTQSTRQGQDPWDNPLVLQYLEESPFGWKKPLGTGTTVWTGLPGGKFPNFSLVEWASWLATDKLFSKCYDQNVQKQFFWLTHTYTHLAFFNITTYDADIELTANEYFASYLGLNGKAHYSPGAMVTPRISGLFNGDALKTIAAHKITSIVGDNSQPALVPWTNRYHGWYTNATTNGYNGMFVIPRFALNIYFHMADPNKNLELYNIFYNATLGMTDLPTFFERESWRCASQLLALLMDPYMTHQANLVMFDTPAGIPTFTGYAKQSLATLWMEKTLEKVVRYVKLPIKTQKQQDLEKTYLDRMALDNCGHVATASVGADGKMSSINLVAPRACTVPVTGVTVAGLTAEADAGETRYWVPLTANAAKTLTITPVTWWTTSQSSPTTTTPVATSLIQDAKVQNQSIWFPDGAGYKLGTSANKTCGSITASGQFASAWQQIDLSANKFTSGVFTVTASFSSSNLVIPAGSQAGFYIEVKWADGSDSLVQVNAPSGSYSWTGVSAVVKSPCKIPSTMKVQILVRPDVQGTMNFTDVILYQGVANASATPVTTPVTLAPTPKVVVPTPTTPKIVVPTPTKSVICTLLPILCPK